MASKSITIKDYWNEIPGELLNDEHVFPVVLSQNTRGQETKWELQVHLEDTDGNKVPVLREYYDNKTIPDNIVAKVKTYSGIIGKTIRESACVLVTRGKGRGASKHNVFCQALRDALSKYNKKLRTAKGSQDFIPPMLAQLNPRKIANLKYPVYIQRKYDGNRAVATLSDGAIVMYSRKLHSWEGHQNIKKELQDIATNYLKKHKQYLHFDGEIYKHGLLIQEYGSARINKVNLKDIDTIPDYDFMVYDLFITDNKRKLIPMTFEERFALLQEVIPNDLKYVFRVPTYKVYSRTEIDEKFKEFIGEKYEGAIIRIPDSPYKPSYNDHHCEYLLKLKPLYDAEYPIVGYTQGSRGKAVGLLIFRCKVPHPTKTIEFNSVPKKTEKERRELFSLMSRIEANGKTHFQNNYLGRLLKVYYEDKSKNGIPQKNYNKIELRSINE